MVSSLEELGELLENNNITPADIEYIVNFMNAENMSPQLAMRRIKAFETLKEKLEDNSDREKAELLEQELQQLKNQLIEKTQLLASLQQEKSGLENEKQELETKSELIDSEREELRRQLELIRDMQFTDDEEEGQNQADQTALVEQLMNELVAFDDDNWKKISQPFVEALKGILENGEVQFDHERVKGALSDLALSKTEKATRSTPVSISEEKTKPKTREESKQLEDKKEVATPPPKKQEPEKKVSEKEEQVLNLFLEFIEEAESDKEFQERVSTICDMDEAYQYLGSIGLSQVYSFASRRLDKKKELQDLLDSWKKEGIPR